jgi:hypothetical protein
VILRELKNEYEYWNYFVFLFSDDCGDNSDELNCNEYIMCSFEEPSGMCSWAQDQDNNIDWRIGTGGTESFDTGPKRDHTLGLPSGHYIFFEASYPAVKDDRARIASSVLNSTGNSCRFRFYWHLYGEVSIHIDFKRYIFIIELRFFSLSK